MSRAEAISYDDRADAMQRRANEALGQFLATVPQDVRLAMLNLDSIKSPGLQQRLRETTGAEFVQIVSGLPPERQRRLFLVEPKSSGDIGLEGDVAESPAASYRSDLAGDIDNLADELAEQFRFDERTAAGIALFTERFVREQAERYNDWLLAKIIIRLTSAENCKVAAAALAFAIGVKLVWVNGELYPNQLKAAKPLGCSRQNLSKAVRSAAEFLGIDRGIHLKPPEAVAAFKVAQVAKAHWRNKIYGQ